MAGAIANDDFAVKLFIKKIIVILFFKKLMQKCNFAGPGHEKLSAH